MIHLHPSQYNQYVHLKNKVDQEIAQKTSTHKIFDHIMLEGQEHGFCNDEIRQLIQLCLEENE